MRISDWSSYVCASDLLNSNKLSKTTPNVITFTASGTYTPTTGTKLVHVICIGGGGGSGGVGSSAKSGGAGGGAYAESWLSITAVGASKAVTVGAGGSGGASGSNAGSAGGTTSFGTLVSAVGGAATGGNDEIGRAHV